jgi:hypothetical protein
VLAAALAIVRMEAVRETALASRPLKTLLQPRSGRPTSCCITSPTHRGLVKSLAGVERESAAAFLSAIESRRPDERPLEAARMLHDGARIAFIVNPTARQGHDRGTIDAVARGLGSRFAVEIVVPPSADDVRGR